MRNFLLIMTSVLLAAGGQLLLKKGMLEFGAINAKDILSQLFVVFKNPWVLSGLVAFVSSFLLWLVVLSKNDLSYAYPMVSVSYVVVLLGSRWIFQERLDVWKIVGVALICLGVALIARNHQKSIGTGLTVPPDLPIVSSKQTGGTAG